MSWLRHIPTYIDPFRAYIFSDNLWHFFMDYATKANPLLGRVCSELVADLPFFFILTEVLYHIIVYPLHSVEKNGDLYFFDFNSSRKSY